MHRRSKGVLRSLWIHWLRLVLVFYIIPMLSIIYFDMETPDLHHSWYVNVLGDAIRYGGLSVAYLFVFGLVVPRTNSHIHDVLCI